MLDREALWKCHLFVPVWYWPVLWHYLARLKATILLNRAEGRGSFAWSVDRTGVIYITWQGESAAERAARGALPDGFDPAPWRRLTLDAPAGPTGPEPAHERPGTGLVLHRQFPALAPLDQPARAPPRGSALMVSRSNHAAMRAEPRGAGPCFTIRDLSA